MDDVAAAEQPAQPVRVPGPLRLGGREFAPGQLLVMAIVNRTPDSFYRPGLTWDEDAALERIRFRRRQSTRLAERRDASAGAGVWT